MRQSGVLRRLLGSGRAASSSGELSAHPIWREKAYIFTLQTPAGTAMSRQQLEDRIMKWRARGSDTRQIRVSMLDIKELPSCMPGSVGYQGCLLFSHKVSITQLTGRSTRPLRSIDERENEPVEPPWSGDLQPALRAASEREKADMWRLMPASAASAMDAAAATRSGSGSSGQTDRSSGCSG